MVDRAIALAQSDPKVPVYLTLPREVLASGMNGYKLDVTSSIAPAATPHGDPKSLAQASQYLAQARKPVKVASKKAVVPKKARAETKVALAGKEAKKRTP